MVREHVGGFGTVTNGRCGGLNVAEAAYICTLPPYIDGKTKNTFEGLKRRLWKPHA